MPQTKVTIGYGTLFEIADPATPTAWTYIAEIFDVKPPAVNVAQSDATSNQSPNRSREFIPGLIDQQEMSFSMNYIPGSSSDTAILQSVGRKRNCRITYPNGVSVLFVGSLSTYEPDSPTEERQMASVSLTLSGGFVLTPPAAPRFVVNPVISGVAVVGSILQLDAGVIGGAIRTEVQWQRSTDSGVGAAWADITGAEALAYVPVAADVGERIRALVTAANDAFTTDQASLMTAVVA